MPPPVESEVKARDFDVREAANLRGLVARQWFAKQLMLPEWMIDVPHRLNSDSYVCARPAGKCCFVVSSNGVTVSRLRNGSMLHHFPSALPNNSCRHAHYESENTPLVLVWKDESCSQYVLDTDSNGEIPNQQQVMLELLDNGKLAALDHPPVIFGCLGIRQRFRRKGIWTGDVKEEIPLNKRLRLN
ncbi:snurportin-1-like [Salvia divinorum]|uniref:Snurportin-1 n=1 Tax=Salvia divinorum TaxID=28513 RepID=A0ABD1GB23_SALDI